MNIIIVEGSKGVGKTTLSNWLREQIPYCNLIRLSGHSDFTPTGLDKSLHMYDALIHYLVELAQSNSNMTVVLDRCWISDYIYCQMGFREYNFPWDTMIQYISELLCHAKIFMIDAYLGNEEDFTKRLNREKANHGNILFDVANSINEQLQYSQTMEGLFDVIDEIVSTSHGESTWINLDMSKDWKLNKDLKKIINIIYRDGGLNK